MGAGLSAHSKRLNVLMVGLSGSGKTTILYNWRLQEVQKDFKPTDGRCGRVVVRCASMLAFGSSRIRLVWLKRLASCACAAGGSGGCEACRAALPLLRRGMRRREGLVGLCLFVYVTLA